MPARPKILKKAAPPAPVRRGALARALQEALTAVVRLRTDPAAAASAGAGAFRARLKQLLAGAERQAIEQGYRGDDVKLALYAVIVFLDESVLTAAHPAFADWARKPLQEELFGGHTGGEIFFDQLERLLARPDDEDAADVLEVYQLCLLLGFHGRYGPERQGELRGLVRDVAEKLRRVRGGVAELSPAWRPPDDAVPPGRDPWIPRLAVGAGAIGVGALALFVVCRLALQAPLAELAAAATRLAR
jgi:type VI secretion system protein ImpK